MQSIQSSTTSARVEFFAGVASVLPLLAAATPFAILFGVLSLTAGLPYWAAQAMSLFVFAGASQFVAVGLVAQGVSYPLIVLTTLIVNLRHAFYGASVADHLRGLSRAWRAFLAFSMVDESYAIAITHYRDTSHGDAAYKHWYFLGANIGLLFFWNVGTAIGYFLGRLIGDPLALGLDFTLPLVFIAILIPQLKTRAHLISAITAAILAVLGYALPNKLGLLFAMAFGVVIGFGVEKWITRS